MPNPTKYQQKAMDFTYGNCLVSAGAGSGKTEVLTTRIYHLVKPRKDPVTGEMKPICPLSKMLVLTFTNKAAYEMKQRTRLNIARDPETRHLLPEVEQATITTFDGFALSLVKTYHYELGIDENVNIVDASMIEVERYRLIDEILKRHYERAYEGQDPSFLALVKAFCIKDDRHIVSAITNAYSLAALQPNKREFLANYAQTHFVKAFYDRMLEQYIEMIHKLFDQCLRIVSKYNNADLASKDSEYLEELNSFKTYGELASKLKTGPGLPKKPSIKKEDKTPEDFIDEALRNLMREAFGKIKEMCKPDDEASLLDTYRINEGYLKTICDLAVELIDAEAKFMKDHCAYRFEDIDYLARELARKPEIREKLRKTYSFIMIDEYQDTSDLQEELIELISTGNTFCVGDIKQSIYRFRNANPALFYAKQQKYKSHPEEGSLITLPDNFRSREQVISDINAIFEKIMSDSVGGADYASGHALAFGNHGYDDTASCEDYGVQIYRYTPDDDLDTEEQEATIIANDILQKIRSGFKVAQAYLGDDGQYHTKPVPADFSSFAILTSTKTIYDTYMRVFNEYGIPLAVSTEIELKEESIYYVLKDIFDFISGINKGRHDVHMKHLYAAIARSFLIGDTDESIYHALHDDTYMDAWWAKMLVSYQSELGKLTLDQLFEKVIEIFDIPAKLPLVGNVMGNFERLEALYGAAKTGSQFGWTLDDYVAYFEDLGKYEIKLGQEVPPAESKAVKLMSIHASKGLQFPIVYMSQLYRKFKSKRPGSSALFDYDLDFGLNVPNVDPQSMGENIHSYLHSFHNDAEDVSEKMRLFYVGLTRAQELAILIQSKGEFDKDGNYKERFLTDVSESKSFCDFIYFLNGIGLRCVDVDKMENSDAIAPQEGTSRAFEFRSIDALAKPLPPVRRPSKAIKGAVDEGSLAFGTRLHRLLELSDLAGRDCSFIDDPNEREIIEKVLKLPIFSTAKDAKIYKEYEFVSPEGQAGVIDLLMVYDDYAVIVDYKANRIDDDAYGEQLKSYKRYVEAIFCKPAKTYLLSILKAELREISLAGV